MQTAAIPYRVADFLKQHPPFQFIGEADLIALASRGRVKFHEPEEYVCWQASPHTPFVFVIQQGSVSLWDETTDPPTLRDIRGPGDIIGIERFNGSETSLHSAKTASEVVIYALQASELESLLARYPEAAQYVAAYSDVTADYHAPGERPKPHETFLADLVTDRTPPQCAAATPIQEAAALLNASGTQAIALMDGTKFAGLLTTGDLITWIAAGAHDPTAPATEIAQRFTRTLAPQSLVSDGILALAELRANAAVITADGSPNTALQSIITTSSFTPAFGDNPAAILHSIAHAQTLTALRTLNQRAHSWILDNLSSSAAIDWLSRWVNLVNRDILTRALQLTGNLDANFHTTNVYCFYGAAGRQELLTLAAPSLAIIGTVPDGLEAALAECGYLAPKPLAAGLQARPTTPSRMGGDKPKSTTVTTQNPSTVHQVNHLHPWPLRSIVLQLAITQSVLGKPYVDSANRAHPHRRGPLRSFLRPRSHRRPAHRPLRPHLRPRHAHRR